jgi:hypothetical protein
VRHGRAAGAVSALPRPEQAKAAVVLRKNSRRDCLKLVVMMQAAETRASNDVMSG